MEIKLQATKVLEKILQSNKRFVALQGSSRSSKTFSIAQYIILQCVNAWAGQKKVITISRKTFPALRGSVMRDFFQILETLKLYSPENFNQTTHEYALSGNLIEFVSCDEPQKIRGRKRNVCWLNEANEFEYDDFFQFDIRTSERVFFDYNPSDEFHWLYDKILTRDDCDFIHSTYRDNPFLEKSLVEEIERLKNEDENLWKIYGLGERGKAQDLIFTNWQVVESFPPVCEHYRYGVDFGWNHPSVLVLVGIRENDVYIQEIIYETHLTNQDFIARMKEKEVSRAILMKADSAEPDRIREIQMSGFKIEPAKKSHAFNKDAIDNIKRRKIHITASSVNVVKEIKNYRWKKDPKTGVILDEPIDFRDDAMSALRYAIGDIITDSHLFQQAMLGDFEKRADLPRRYVSRI